MPWYLQILIVVVGGVWLFSYLDRKYFHLLCDNPEQKSRLTQDAIAEIVSEVQSGTDDFDIGLNWDDPTSSEFQYAEKSYRGEPYFPEFLTRDYDYSSWSENLRLRYWREVIEEREFLEQNPVGSYGWLERKAEQDKKHLDELGGRFDAGVADGERSAWIQATDTLNHLKQENWQLRSQLAQPTTVQPVYIERPPEKPSKLAGVLAAGVGFAAGYSMVAGNQRQKDAERIARNIDYHVSMMQRERTEFSQRFHQAEITKLQAKLAALQVK